MISPIQPSLPAAPAPQADVVVKVAKRSPDSFEQRSLDGSGNNLQHPEFNKAGTAFIRKTEPDFADGISEPSGADRPGPREISNALVAQDKDIPDPFAWSGMLWGWGQFVDHDLTHTWESKDTWKKIPVPKGDPHFDPNSTGEAYIPYAPVVPAPGTGPGTDKPLAAVNLNSGWLDGSMIYGSDAKRADALRTHAGGKLTVGDYNNLPFNTLGLDNDNDVHAPPESLLISGDVRVNENPLLLSLHTIFMREHNRQADHLAMVHPEWNDQKLYDGARKRVGALIQSITYQEYLPNLLGPTRMPAYKGYQPDVDPRVAIEFAAAGFRLGHSQLGSTIFRNEQDADMIAQGDIKLRDAFFNPGKTLNEGGIAPVLRGACDYVEQATDIHMVDDVRNFLFGAPGAGGLDLAAINMARGRELGIPAINGVRVAYGSLPRKDFKDLAGKQDEADAMQGKYNSLDKVDAWIGIVGEKPDEGTILGNTARHIIVDQFTRLRDGDRFYYENDPELRDEVEAIKSTTLSRVIARNLGEEFQPYAFHGKEVVRD